jgi:hypothetical protein
MSEKHKSKYKKPENTKHTSRKDLKDYTLDNKESMNPYSTGEKQSNVLRKTDKEVIDNGSLVQKYNDSDHLYKDLESGEYDPKHAAKVLKKRQDAEESDIKDVIADKYENLTREQKERVTREYIKQQIKLYIFEQEEPIPLDEPTAATPEAPVAEPTAPVAEPTVPVAEPVNVDNVESKTELDSAVSTASALLSNPKVSTNDLVKATNIIMNTMTKDLDIQQKSAFYQLMRKYANKQLGKFSSNSN